jgi:hypothetical protein
MVFPPLYLGNSLWENLLTVVVAAGKPRPHSELLSPSEEASASLLERGDRMLPMV